MRKNWKAFFDIQRQFLVCSNLNHHIILAAVLSCFAKTLFLSMGGLEANGFFPLLVCLLSQGGYHLKSFKNTYQ